jgi:hypothetical protein
LLIPTELDGITLLVESVPVPGSEPTSRRETKDRIQDMFARAKNVIENIATTSAELKDSLAAKSREPDRLEIEFGISFGVQGQIVLAGASAKASLSVRIIYDGNASVDGEGHRDDKGRSG